MMKFLYGSLIVVFAASVVDAQCSQSPIQAPTPNHPYMYVIGQGTIFNNVDKHLCEDFHLATFELDPSPAGKLLSATLTMSAWDVDPGEENIVLVDQIFPAGPMYQGGNDCWSVTMLDVTYLVTVGGIHDVYIDIDSTKSWCSQIDWVALEMVYEPLVTIASTPEPTTPVPTTAAPTNGVKGDPHFKTWIGEPYDFHGICDLVLLSNPHFKNDLGMYIHIRTKKTRAWSYVSSVAIRIGDDTFEARGGSDEIQYWINGERGVSVSDSSEKEVTMLPASVAGHTINFKQHSLKAKEFVVNLTNDDEATTAVLIKIWNAYVGVSIRGATEEYFKSSVGMMGAFPHGTKMARDNINQINDDNVFGQEWQVLVSEPVLFHNIEGPQAPSHCHIPSMSQMRRRLGESQVTRDEAEFLCSRVSKEDYDLCIFDVMATNDIGIAGAY